MAEKEYTIYGERFNGKDSRIGKDRFDYQKNSSTVTPIPIYNDKIAIIGEEPASYIPIITPNGIKYIPIYSQKYGSSGSRGPYSNITFPEGRICNLCYSNCNKNYSNYDNCKSTCDTICNACNSCQGCQSCNSCYSTCNPTCNSCQGCTRCQGCDSCQGCVGCEGCVSCQSCDSCQGGCYGCVSCYGSCRGCDGCHGSHNCYGENCGSCHVCQPTDK